MERCCGLVTDKKEKVPLKSVEVGVQVLGHVATLSSTLLYVNEEERPLEAVFVFPLPAECKCSLISWSAVAAEGMRLRYYLQLVRFNLGASS